MTRHILLLLSLMMLTAHACAAEKPCQRAEYLVIEQTPSDSAAAYSHREFILELILQVMFPQDRLRVIRAESTEQLLDFSLPKARCSLSRKVRGKLLAGAWHRYTTSQTAIGQAGGEDFDFAKVEVLIAEWVQLNPQADKKVVILCSRPGLPPEAWSEDDAAFKSLENVEVHFVYSRNFASTQEREAVGRAYVAFLRRRGACLLTFSGSLLAIQRLSMDSIPEAFPQEAGAGKGKLHVRLSWSNPESDVDLIAISHGDTLWVKNTAGFGEHLKEVVTGREEIVLNEFDADTDLEILHADGPVPINLRLEVFSGGPQAGEKLVAASPLQLFSKPARYKKTNFRFSCPLNAILTTGGKGAWVR